VSKLLKDKKIGFHIRIGSKDDAEPLMEAAEKFLQKRGVNCLVLEMNTSYKFKSHPELSEGTLSAQEAEMIVKRAQNLGMDVIPLFECLGHQGWGGSPNSLLRVYPQFDETPYIPYEAKWPEIYCRSWCPNNEEVYKIVFSLIDELIQDFKPKYFHVGMDEVFILADDSCPRCRGKNKAELFSKVVNELYDHVKRKKGIELILWGDRLINKEETGYSIWDADTFGIWPAVDMIPKDMIIGDWHYDLKDKYPSIEYFIEKGFRIWPSCWKDKEAAKAFFEYAVNKVKELKKEEFLFGLLVTGWNLSGRSVFETVENFEKFKNGQEVPQHLKDTFDVLDTLDTVYHLIIKNEL